LSDFEVPIATNLHILRHVRALLQEIEDRLRDASASLIAVPAMTI
jgi:hypothetical protein